MKSKVKYKSLTDAVIAMRKAKLSTVAIAKRLCITPECVLAFEDTVPPETKQPPVRDSVNRTVLFPIEILAALGAPAARRGVHPNHLARMIVEQVVDDGLIDAVLDDQKTGAAHV